MKKRYPFMLCLLLICGIACGAAAQTARGLVVESISIEGNSKTRPGVIRNYLSFAEGDSITREQLQNDEARLRQTNFFKEVKLLATPGSDKTRTRVVVQVKERHWPTLQFKSGFNELDGWYISPLGIRFDNIFGRGNYLGAELVIGDRVGGTELEFVWPFVWGTEYDFEARAFGYTRDFIHFFGENSYLQKVRDGGLLLRVSGNSGLAKFLSVSYIAQRVDADTFLSRRSEKAGEPKQVPAPPFLVAQSDTQKIRRYVVAATIDTRDRRVHPTRGWWGSISFDQSSKELGSFRDYNRVIVDIRRYHPLWKQVVGALRVKWGRVGENAPFYEKFYLGGPNSLRGYEDRGLTPQGYAANLTLASGELRFPLSRRLKDKTRLTGVLFYDAGYAWSKPDRWEFSRIKSGAGFGVRARLPIVGLLRVDFAYSVPRYDFHLHLSLGHTF